MIVIRSKPEYENCSCQNTKDKQAFSIQRLRNLTSDQTANLQSSAQLESNRTGVAADQVAGSDAASDVAGLGKVLPILSSGGGRGMTSGSDRGEGHKAPFGRDDLESPFSVDALNVSQRNHDFPDQIVENELSLSDFNAWSPEQEIAEIPNPAGRNQTNNHGGRASALNTDTQRDQQDNAEGHAKVFSESGLKLHLDTTLGGK